jgi:hypothetical protein
MITELRKRPYSNWKKMLKITHISASFIISVKRKGML